MPARKTREQFIHNAILKHGHEYDYSKVNYINSKVNVEIICSLHGSFWQTPNNHLKGAGCPECSGNKKITAEAFIEKANQVHNNEYDYSKVDYLNSSTKVCIICPEHGEFWQTPIVHLSGQGCPECSFENRAKSTAFTTEQFIQKAKAVHGEKYDYSKVNYINYKTKVCIICPEHGEFIQTPNDHLNGCGCPECGKLKNIQLKKFSKDEILLKAFKVHGDKYDYSKLDFSKTIIIDKQEIICPLHGSFWQQMRVHLDGHECPKCADIIRNEKKTKTTEQFIEDAKKIYGDKYTYEKVKYKNAFSEVIITCQKHGDFIRTAHYFLNGSECPYCNERTHRTKEMFIEEANKLFNSKYDYSNIDYKNFTTSIEIICKEHGGFWLTPRAHLNGGECPQCIIKSHGENRIKKWLENHGYILNETFFQEQKFDDLRSGKGGNDYLRFDFYIPSKNLVIEYQGELHFERSGYHGGVEKLEKQKLYDQMKRDWCKEKGIQELEIHYKDYKTLDKILEDAIL